MRVRVALPASDVGHSYQDVAAGKDTTPRWSLAVDQSVTLGDQRYTTPHAQFPFLADRVENRGARRLFPIVNRCVSVVVSAPADAVARYTLPRSSGSGSGIAGLVDTEPAWYLPAGTVLVTPGGRAVTRARHKIAVPGPAGRARRVCIQRRLVISSNLLEAPHLVANKDAGTLRLCARIAAIRRGSPSADRLGSGSMKLR